MHSQLRDLLERKNAELAKEQTDSDCVDNNVLNGFESMYGTTVCVRHNEGGEQASDTDGAGGKDSRNGFTIGRTGSPGNNISSGGASPVKSPGHENNMLEDDKEKDMAMHLEHMSKDDATITIELTQESEGKNQWKEEKQFAAEVSAIMVQLPEELQGVLRTEGGHEWNYRKFFEVIDAHPAFCLSQHTNVLPCLCVLICFCSSLQLPAVQYLSTQLLNIDKDVRRCDREYPFFQVEANLLTVRNLVAT